MTTEIRASPTAPAATTAVQPRPVGQRGRETRGEAEARRAEQQAVLGAIATSAESAPLEVLHGPASSGLSMARATPDHREPGVERWLMVDGKGRRIPETAWASPSAEIALRHERAERGWQPAHLPK